MRAGATDPIETAILKVGRQLFDLVPAQVKEPMVGTLFSALSDLTQVAGDEGFRSQIGDQARQFQLQSSKSRVDTHLYEFPVGPTLQKCKEIGLLLIAPEAAVGIDAEKTRSVFDVTVAFMVEETTQWVQSDGEYEKLWAVHISGMMKGLLKTSDDKVWLAAVAAVADLQCMAQRMTNPAVARDCARLMLAVKHQCRSLQVPEKIESKTSTEQANQWVDIVMGPMMQKVDRGVHPFVLADLQQL